MAIKINPTNEDLRIAVLQLENTTGLKGTFTLSGGASVTTVPCLEVGENSVVHVAPTNSASAAEWAAGTMWVECQRRQFLVHHSNSVSTDRTFKYTVTI